MQQPSHDAADERADREIQRLSRVSEILAVEIEKRERRTIRFEDITPADQPGPPVGEHRTGIGPKHDMLEVPAGGADRFDRLTNQIEIMQQISTPA